ncbi:MAG: hypothetical protein JWL76_1955 [Thermoleophilia bacterium]|nr:hypothetical protein [Thermoleophilia bacterium]
MRVLAPTSSALLPPGAAATATPHVPGPELPAVPPHRPGLPVPPSLRQLDQLAAAADPAHRSADGAHPSTMHNAHYSNTRSQLAYALTHPFNSIEGDIRLRDGVLVMQHDGVSEHDLTFEQWATLVATAGRHMRLDVKEAAALAPVEETVRRLGIPDGIMTFNVGLGTPWFQSNMPAEAVAALRARHPRSWITVNLPLPTGPVYEYAVRVARRIGPERLGTTILATHVSRDAVRKLRGAFAFLNAWNVPGWKPIDDIDAETARLRAMGVNGMIDLRRRDDPLGSDD